MVRPGHFFRPDAFKLAATCGLAFAALHFLNGVSLGRGFEVPVVSRVEHAAQDWALTRLRGARSPSGRVVVVAIDERSLEAEGRWPWSRERMATLVDRLAEGGVAAAGFDVIWSEEEGGEGTARLADAIERARLVTVGFAFVSARDLAGTAMGDRVARLRFFRTEPVHVATAGRLVAREGVAPLGRFAGAIPPLEDVLAAADSAGFVTIPPDPDGAIRRYLTVASAGGETFPALGVALLARASGRDGRPAPVVPVGADGAPETLQQVRIGERILPVDDLGRVPLAYAGRWRDFPSWSATDVLHSRIPRAEMAGKIAIVGTTAVGTWDQRVTPFDDSAPGVVAHATFVENALRGELLERSGAILAGEVALMVALAFGLALVLARASSLLAAAAAVLAAAGWVALAALALRRGNVVLALGMPLAQQLAMFVSATTWRFASEEREKRRARQAFGRFLSPAIVDEVLARDGALRLGGEKRVLTVLFADLRGFTALAEQLDPRLLLELLNEVLAPMTDVVVSGHQGTLDKYIGDAIMAFWGAPAPQPDHAVRACRAALDMVERLEPIRAAWRARGLPDVDLAIGVNSGPMSVGFVGSQDRFYNYTVLGDAVNLASRLEGANREYGTRILLGPLTHDLVRDSVVARELDLVRVKGKREPVRIHELLALAPAPPALGAFLHRFADGLAAYRAQRWDDASARFEEADRLRGGDPASRKYVERCETMRRAPPGPEWDGAFEMTTK